MEVMYLIKTDRYGKKFLIGELTKNNKGYIFKYIPEAPDKSEGFLKVPTFKDFDKIYKSENLFLFFANRLYDRGRPDLQKILESYGLNEYDEWELLKATRAKLMTDNYELTQNRSI